MSWVNHDLQNREDRLESLLEHVRLPLMSQDYIVQRVEEEPLIKGNSRCKDFLIEAMKYHLLKLDQKAMYKTPRTQPRNPIGLPKVSVTLTYPCKQLLVCFKPVKVDVTVRSMVK